MKASSELLRSSLVGGPDADAGFQDILGARGCVPLILGRQDAAILTAFLQAVVEAEAKAYRDGETDALRFSLLRVASASAERLLADLRTVKPFMQHDRLLTRDEAMDLVSSAAPCVDIDLDEGSVLRILRNDVATSLYGLRVLLIEVDVEATARRMSSPIDKHESEPRRPQDIAMVDEAFHEAFPAFEAGLRSLSRTLDGLGYRLGWEKPRLPNRNRSVPTFLRNA